MPNHQQPPNTPDPEDSTPENPMPGAPVPENPMPGDTLPEAPLPKVVADPIALMMIAADMHDDGKGRPAFSVSWERNFITRMKRLREARQMTQTDLSKEVRKFGLPFHQQTIQRIEMGERPIRLNEAFIIAAALDVTIDVMTASGLSLDQELVVAVNGLRVGTTALDDRLHEDFRAWFESMLPLVHVMKERLARLDEDGPVGFDDLDDVTKWGLAWCFRAEAAWNSLDKGQDLLHRIIMRDAHYNTYRFKDEGGHDWGYFQLESMFMHIQDWCERFRDADIDPSVNPAELFRQFPGDLGMYEEPPF